MHILESPFLSCQDHERIRGGLYFVESIPRDENWKVLKGALKEYKPRKGEEEQQQEEEVTD